jgi:hypothetical protein
MICAPSSWARGIASATPLSVVKPSVSAAR